MDPKVLVASPTYIGMNYCEDEFLQALKNIEYPNFDILIIDNSKEDFYFNKLKEIKGINVIRDNFQEGYALKRVIHSRNKILDYALENNYDFVFMVDSDVIIPKNILLELLKQNKNIVSGIYHNYFKIDGKQKLRSVVWKDAPQEVFDILKKQEKLPDFIRGPEDLRRHLTPEEENSGKCIEVTIPSAGCILISKKVFKVVRYGLLDLPGNLKSSDDVYFIKSARKKGFKVYCHTKLKCEHRIKGKYSEEGYHPIYDIK